MASAPKSRLGKVIVVSFYDYACAISQRQQVTNVLPRVVTSRTKSSELELQLILVEQAIKPATIELKIAGTRLVADEDELNVVFPAPTGKSFQYFVGRRD
jgi:hypothetical protein